MFERLKTVADSLKRELGIYRIVLKHSRTPKMARILLGLAVGYALMPFDLIPDWIPVIGHLYDLVIVPALVFVALKLIPDDVIREWRSRSVRPSDHGITER